MGGMGAAAVMRRPRRIGLAELVLRIRIGKQLLISLRTAVVELESAPVTEDQCIVLIAREEIGIRPKEFFHFGRDTSGRGGFNLTHGLKQRIMGKQQSRKPGYRADFNPSLDSNQVLHLPA
jgi:hypothetical protein